jgi:hypothetical protein
MVPDMSSPEPEYQVALSFAGEQRAYVEAVASELSKRGVRSFYDADDEINLWGKNLIEHLQHIYMTASNVVVMFISQDYARKSWPIHERRSAVARALNERREYILPVRFDETELSGLDPSVKALPATDRPPEKLADNIVTKLVQLGGRIEPPKPEFRSEKSRGDGTCRVVVQDDRGQPIDGASVLLVAPNGTACQGTTGADGVVEVSAAVQRNVAVLVAHPRYRAGFYRQHDNGTDLAVTLPGGTEKHSMVMGTTGHFPGFGPRIAPIGDRHDSEGVPPIMYMYVENGSVDGRAEQPFHFRIGHPMMLEDSDGQQIRATCVGFVGRSTLWEYEYPG